jgi:hypothetical protein
VAWIAQHDSGASLSGRCGRARNKKKLEPLSHHSIHMELDAPLPAMHQGRGSQDQFHGVCGLWQGARSWAPSGDLRGLLLAQGSLPTVVSEDIYSC